MFLGILTKLDTVTELSAYVTIVSIVLFCLLVRYTYRIKIMIEFYFERDGGEEWESIKKAKKDGWEENSAKDLKFWSYENEKKDSKENES